MLLMNTSSVVTVNNSHNVSVQTADNHSNVSDPTVRSRNSHALVPTVAADLTVHYNKQLLSSNNNAPAVLRSSQKTARTSWSTIRRATWPAGSSNANQLHQTTTPTMRVVASSSLKSIRKLDKCSTCTPTASHSPVETCTMVHGLGVATDVIKESFKSPKRHVN